ncbi:MAG: tyrosine-type recombinase/integrase [Thermodesulfobacteriota bacterium]|nr:tyrosine-type recombinase/integrase [Thermodesulfobacteriota bacterium]
MMPIRSKKKVHPPTVLTKETVQTLFMEMKGKHLLKAKLLYGSELRLMECIRLRIQDVDFGQNKIYVRGGKGVKDRLSVLPLNIRDELRSHIDRVTVLHHEDLVKGFGKVNLPNALDRKYPNAAIETGWQYVFPVKKRSIDPHAGKKMRHHVLETGLQKAVKRAVNQSGIYKNKDVIPFDIVLQRICWKMA